MSFCTAVLLAAGSGTRFDKEKTKQKHILLGKSVLRRSAEALASSALVDTLVVVVREDEQTFAREELSFLSKPYEIVCGADTRQGSARIGFLHIPSSTTEVLIHDAARCLITPEAVDEVVLAVRKFGAASAVCKVNDTVKRLDENGRICATVDRSRLCLASTPQGFSAPLYRRALEASVSVTDDNMLLEAMGVCIEPVYVSENPKITTAEDMLYAEFLLRKRGEKDA